MIVVLTAQHTGTHFVRILLEAHPAVSWCVPGDARINPGAACRQKSFTSPNAS
jgi:hypothetical protein